MTNSTDTAPDVVPSPDGESTAFRMRIGGMSCSFCTSTITKAYCRIDGVTDVGVSLAHEEGLVTYDPSKVDEDRLRRTIEQLGYVYRDPDKVRTFEQDAAELARERRRLTVAGALTVLSLSVMAVGPWFELVKIPAMPAVMATIALVTMFGPGWFIKRMAWSSLRRGIFNQHVLLEFAAFAGLAGGALGVWVLKDFPTGDFFAASTLVTTYHVLSHYASLAVRTRSSQAVRKLMALRPDTARVVRDGHEIEVAIDEVVVGDRVRVRPGESVPVDGIVVGGESAVDQALVTGEPIPADKTTGDHVIGGSINRTGTLLVEVEAVGEASFLSQVARSIEAARSLRPGVLAVLDVVLRWYVPFVLTFATAGFVGWAVGPWLVDGSPDWNRALLAGLAGLVMGYPCALGMATPLATIRGGGEAATRGILMRSGEAFQIIGDVSVAVLDKTGTITAGKPTLHAIIPAAGVDQDDLLTPAASAEAASEHPLARAIEDAANRRGLTIDFPQRFSSHTGRGIEAEVEGSLVRVGKPGWLAEDLDLSGLDQERLGHESAGRTVVAVARDGRLLGLLAIGDAIKTDAAEAVARLRAAGVRPVMLTGDNIRTARAVAAEIGIDEVRADVQPADKAQVVRDLQQDGTRVMMVGDGINDAPALTQADVGIAIGAGTDIAIEAADIVVMGDRLGSVPDAIEIGASSYRKTRQNLALAFAFNGIGVPTAATGLVSPVWAMIAMIASVTAVLTNSFAGRLLAGQPLNLTMSAPGLDDHHTTPTGRPTT